MNVSNQDFPVLILGYQRLESTINVVKAAIATKPEKIYLSLDGSTDSKILETQDSISENFEKLCLEAGIPFKILLREENLGLKNAVISGIDWFFSENSEGYILEDDLEISPLFFEYTRLSREYFQSRSDVLLISGNQFEHGLLADGPLLSSYPLIWGWYTNKEKWNVIKSLISNNVDMKKVRLPIKVGSFWHLGAMMADSGLSQSWAIPFAARFRKYNFKCIVPNCNLISNIGVDDFASHTNEKEIENSYPIEIAKAKRMISNSTFWKFSEQDPSYLERYVYRIKFRHTFLILKILLVGFTEYSKKHFFQRNKKKSGF